MSGTDEVEAARSTTADERSPLLVHGDRAITGVPANGQDPSSPQAQGSLQWIALLPILASLWIGVFLSALDQTLITTILTPISDSFSSFEHISWVATAYLIAAAAVQPLVGKLTDIFGRKRGLLSCNAVFALGTVLCGFATNTSGVVLGRVIAGIGGGGLNTITIVTVSDLVSLRDRGVVQGVANIVFGVGNGLGGVFGGFISDTIGWRWAFLIQVPFIIISGIAVYFSLDLPSHPISRAQLRRVDYLGSITLVAFLVFLLIALNSGGNIVPWNHPLILTALPLSLLFLILFCIVEQRIAREPIMPLSLLWNRSVLWGCLSTFFMVMSIFSILFYLPMHTLLQSQSPNATNAGLNLSPFSLGIPLGSLSAGFLARKTGKIYALSVSSLLLLTITSFVFTTYPSTSPHHIRLPLQLRVINLFLFGAAYGSNLTASLLSLLSSVGHSNQAIITSAFYLFRSTGSVIGVSMSTAIFQNILKYSLWHRLGSKGPEAARVIEIVRKTFEDLFDDSKVPKQWRDEVTHGFEDALSGVFVVVVIFSTVAMGAGLLIRENHLHDTLERK